MADDDLSETGLSAAKEKAIQAGGGGWGADARDANLSDASVLLGGSPTLALYGALDRAFAHFNRALFKNDLPPALLTLRGARNSRGYHHAERFISPGGDRLHELALHPGFFTLQPIEWSLSTLVHEMVHHWQVCFGRPTRSNAHNREWAVKMRELGLPPSKSGLPGGDETGRRMTHWIEPDGLFIKATNELISKGFHWPWMDRYLPETLERFDEYTQALSAHGVTVETVAPAPWQSLPNALDAPSEHGISDDPEQNLAKLLVKPSPPRPSNETRLRCSSCGIRVRTSGEAQLICADCDVPLTPVE